jgi:hypothetical protein
MKIFFQNDHSSSEGYDREHAGQAEDVPLAVLEGVR